MTQKSTSGYKSDQNTHLKRYMHPCVLASLLTIAKKDMEAAQVPINRRVDEEDVVPTGRGKTRFTVVSTRNPEFILVLLLINYIIFHINNCKPTFAPTCIYNGV